MLTEQKKLQDKTLLLVDGSNYLYRAYYAMPNLRGPHGEPTGAMHGIINMLRNLTKKYHSEYLACIFDTNKKTFRKSLYYKYKTCRTPMPENLVLQIDPIYQIIQALGWPILSVEGFEADDIIGTICMRAVNFKMKVLIFTNDKDLLQLVNNYVIVIDTMNNEILDLSRVQAKFGIPASLIVDYLILVGDKIDNIPGIMKCGPKTAVKLLTKYGSLDSIVKNITEIGGAVSYNLRNSLDWLPIAKKLFTICTNCDLTENFQSINKSLHIQPLAYDIIMNLCNKYGLKKLQSNLEKDKFLEKIIEV